MEKQQKIKDVYEKLGFEWNVCEKYITDNGVLILPTPDLKYSLKGYENLVKDKDKFSAFGKEGLKLQPTKLAGIYNNNGWTKIESEVDVPNESSIEFDKQTRFIAGRFTSNGVFCIHLKDTNWFQMDKAFKANLVTHYKKIQILDPPIY